jgi:hypothetical protein
LQPRRPVELPVIENRFAEIAPCRIKPRPLPGRYLAAEISTFQNSIQIYPRTRGYREAGAMINFDTRAECRVDLNESELNVAGFDAKKASWQKDYMRGRTIAGEAAPEHQTGLELRDFVEER